MMRMAITDNQIKKLLENDKSSGGSTLDIVGKIFKIMTNW
jgi:hypothetical protein